MTNLMTVTGLLGTRLGTEASELLPVQVLAYECQRCPGRQTQVDLRDCGREIYVLQSTSPPVDQHLVELLLLADACRRARAVRLQAPMAFIHETRLSGHNVEAHGVSGDVRNRTPLIVDDMLSTGETIAAAVGALREAGAVEPMSVAVTHAPPVGHAHDVLRRLPMTRLIVGNTAAVENVGDRPLAVTSVAPLNATAIRRNHCGESLADLRVRA